MAETLEEKFNEFSARKSPFLTLIPRKNIYFCLRRVHRLAVKNQGLFLSCNRMLYSAVVVGAVVGSTNAG
jgi:hypothetical protein